MKLNKTTFDRVLKLERSGINEETRTVPASISSEYPVRRSMFGETFDEVLVHSADAINFERAERGLPLLYDHDTKQFLGKAQNVRLDGDKLRAELTFSHNQRASEIWADVQAGLIEDISIRYDIEDIDDSKFPTVSVTRWKPKEASVVPVPADATVGIMRAETEDKDMSDNETRTGDGAGSEGSGVDVIKLSEVARRKEQERGAKHEAQRRDDIDDLFADFMRHDGAEEVKQDCLRTGKTIDQARGELLRFLGGHAEPVTKPMTEEQRRGSATITHDAADKWQTAVTEALSVRFGIETDREKIAEARRSNEYLSYTLMDFARAHMRRNGHSITGLSSNQIAGQSLQRSSLITHSTGDFSAILANVANKSVLIGYEQNAETWRSIVRIGSLNDYKQASRVALTSFTDLDRIMSNGEYKAGSTGDVNEYITMRKYGKLFSIGREAILNDDQDLFNRIPRMMGMAAARVVGDMVYDEVLLGNPTLNQDSTELFHADHNNLVAAGSGAAPSVATLNTAFTAMRTQTDPDANSTLNVEPRYLIVPAALEATALSLTTAINMNTAPGATSGEQPVGSTNRFASLTPIVEPRIDADDAAKWFLSADPNMWDTIEVAFLNGNEQPYMEQQEGFTQDGVTYKIRLEATCAAMGYVGLYHNDGN